MKKYLMMLFIPIMMLASCVEDESAYLPQDKENVKVDGVIPDEGGGDEPDIPIDGVLSPGIHLVKMQIEGVERKFKYFMPVSIDPVRPISLIFDFHGSYSIVEGAEELPDPVNNFNANHPFCQLATKENCIIVYPGGISNGLSVDWSKDNYMNGVPFVDEMIKFFKRSTPTIDVNRIYASGHSSGAIFSCVLAFHRSEIFAAVAPRAGRMSMKNQTEMPSRAVHIRMFLGMQDDIVDHPQTLKDMNFWAEKIGGYFENDKVVSKDPFLVEGYNKKVTTTKYNGAKADIEIYSIDNEGHNIDGGAMMPYIWEFFKAHPISGNQINLFVTAQDSSLVFSGSQTLIMPINYTDDATISVNTLKDWEIAIEGKNLKVKAPKNYNTTAITEGVIVIKAERDGESKTRSIKISLLPNKTFFTIGDIYYNDDYEPVGVVAWVNVNNKGEAKIINLELPPSGSIYFGGDGSQSNQLGPKFCTPDKNNGELNTSLMFEQNKTIANPNTSATSLYVWAKEYVYKGVLGWYLPAINEYEEMKENISIINMNLTKAGGKILEGEYYSSTVDIGGKKGKYFYYYDIKAKKSYSKDAANEYMGYIKGRTMKKVTK